MSGTAGVRAWQQHRGAAEGAVGRLGPHPHLRGPLRCRQHLLLPQAGLHILRQPVPGTPAGENNVQYMPGPETFVSRSPSAEW